MKNVLLATTILGMTAGFASAEIAFTGTATAGIAQNGDLVGSTLPEPAGQLAPYASFKLGVAATGESDSGLTYGASTDVTSGITYAMANDDGFDTNGGTFGAPSIFIAGDFGKITVKGNGFKEYQADANEKYDLEYSHSISGFDIGVRTDLHNATSPAGFAATAGKSSLKLGYTVAGIGLGATYDEVGSAWGVSASRAFGPVTATLSTNDASVTALKVAYASDSFSGSIKADSASTWDLEAGYAANGLSVGAATNELDEWKVTTGYDLGGGLAVEAGTNYTNDMFVGAKMSF
jgi:outer membrane protein OmpU